jgi:uncharacterized protein YjbI with pentapeptide repeats
MADAKIDSFDIGALERAVNDSAGRVSGIWLSFVAFSAYLAASASMISHRQIFLEEPVKLPTINIEVPLVASAILLPLLFVIYHIFVLLQVVLLARTADAYNEAIEHGVAEAPDRTRIRQRLANTLFAQLFAGSPREREGVLGWLLRSMAWITLAIAPVCVLMVFEIKFLPYHSAAVTWTHRGLVMLDVLAVLFLWAGAVDPRRNIGWRPVVQAWKTTAGAMAIVLASCLLLTFPGEPGRFWMAYIAPSDQSANDIPECRIAWTIDAVVAPSFDRLVLTGQDFIDNDKLKKVIETAKNNEQKPYESERIRTFRGRDLRCGHLAGTGLRHVDFAEAYLSGAVLEKAHLEGATFAAARLDGVNLDGAQLQDSSFAAREMADHQQLEEAKLPNSSLRGAQLQRANLAKANLAGADLYGAQLEEAHLEEADLRGASFNRAVLRNASLDGAKLQSVSFESASMPGVSLVGAGMQGADFSNTEMYGASFDSARLHGALFYGTKLQGALFRQSQLHGAVFKDARLDGVAFIEAQLQGVQFERQRGLRYVVVSGSYLWHTARVSCNLAQVVTPRFDAVIDVIYSGHRPEIVPVNEQNMAEFIEKSLKDVPAKSKPELQKKLNQHLREPALDAPSAGEQAWRTCADESQARTEKDFQEMTDGLVKFVCAPLAKRNPLIRSFLEGWATGELSDKPIAKNVAKRMLTETCPGAQTLDENTRASLQSLAFPQAE